MNCGKAQHLAQDFVDGRLTDGVARELQRHLTDCADCRVTQQRATRLQQLLAVKRHEAPRAEYFDNFLTEFHQRLSQELAPRPTWWSRFLDSVNFQQLPAFRYGFAHACGLLLAFGMIVRGVILTEFGTTSGSAGTFNFSSLQLPAPHSTPGRIASRLPRSPEVASAVGGALILPVAPRGEPVTPRYVLDRIGLSPVSYEVASIHF